MIAWPLNTLSHSPPFAFYMATQKAFLNSNNNLFLQCSLCEQILMEPVVLNVCSHRFCLKCLNNYLRKERRCPTCGVSCNVEPAYSYDRAFACAIQMFAGGVIFNNDGDEKAASSNDSLSNGTDLPEPLSQPSTVDVSKYTNLNDFADVNVILMPDANLHQWNLPKCVLKTRFLKVPGNATVGHLAAYFYIRCRVESEVDLESKYEIEFSTSVSNRLTTMSQHIHELSPLPDPNTYTSNQLRNNKRLNGTSVDLNNHSSSFGISNSQSLEFSLCLNQLCPSEQLTLGVPFKIIYRLISKLIT